MSNGTRHLLGAIAGIFAIPVVSALVFGGLSLVLRAYSAFSLGPNLYLAGTAVAVGAIVVALLVGTRISPLASLIPGLVFTAAGALAVAAPRTAVSLASQVPSGRMSLSLTLVVSPQLIVENALSNGAFLLVGVVLLVASVAPSRWRGAARTARLATAAGLHRAGPVEEPRFPGPSTPSDPDEPRVTPFPDDPATVQEQPYGDSGPQSPYGGSGPQPPFGGPRPDASYGDSGPQSPYGGSGPQPPYGDARPRSASYDSGPQSRYGDSPAQPLYGAPTPQSPYDSGPQSPYGGPSGEPQAPYRSAFEPPARPGAGNDVTGYAPGYRPSSWSGPQPAYPPRPGPPGRPARPAGDDPYAVPPTEPTPYAQPPEQQPWGPAPDADRVPPRDPFPDTPNADPGRRPSSSDETTSRLPWTEDDRARFRDPRDPRDR